MASSYLPVETTAKKTVMLVNTESIPNASTEKIRVSKGELATTKPWLIKVPKAKVETFFKN